METQFSHVQFNIRPDNMRFYKDLMTLLGWQTTYEQEMEMLGASDKNGASVWFVGHAKDVGNDYDGPGMNHIGISTATQADVDSVAAFLTERDVQALFETPRHRAEFAGGADQTYYQVMFETPDRILVEVVYMGPLAA